MRTGFAIVACLLLWCGATSAQSVARDPKTFRAGVEAIEVDVRVVDADGNPLHGLTRDDFELFEEGVRQEVRTFTVVDVPLAPPARTTAIAPDVQSNRHPFDGRLYALVLDDLHTHPLQANRVKRAVRRFLDDHMASNDRVALVATSGRVEASQELTSSREALLAALDRFQGRKVRSSTLERIDRYLVLASRDVGQAITTKPDPELKARLPLPPTASREFDRRDALTVFAEVYDNRKKGLEPIELVTTITDSGGTVTFRAQETVEGFAFEPARKTWTHRLEIPLTDLAPGAYVLAVEAKPRGSLSSAVSRRVPFSVRLQSETTP